MKRGPFDNYVQIVPSGCWEWTGELSSAGYGRYRRLYSHRLSYERHKGPIPAGMHVCHSCDNPPCVNPDHLWLGTARDNARDRAAKGRNRNGEREGAKNPNSKLSLADVCEIRKLSGTVTRKDLAVRYGVSPTTISNIAKGVTWKGIGEP